MNVPSDDDRVMILEASGHSLVYANGEPRAGDPYSHGYVHLPVKLRKGDNEFLFSVGRGTLKARLVDAEVRAHSSTCPMPRCPTWSPGSRSIPGPASSW